MIAEPIFQIRLALSVKKNKQKKTGFITGSANSFPQKQCVSEHGWFLPEQMASPHENPMTGQKSDSTEQTLAY